MTMVHASSHAADRHDRDRPRAGLRARRAGAPAARFAAGRLSAGRRADRPVHPRLRCRSEHRRPARRDRRHPADVRRRAAFLARRICSRSARSRSPARSARSRSRPCSAWRSPMRSAGPLGAGLVFGLALSVASTVVLLRALQERRLVETERGRIAVGWLIVEDIAMVLALVLLPALADIAERSGRRGLGHRRAAASADARQGHRPSSR